MDSRARFLKIFIQNIPFKRHMLGTDRNRSANSPPKSAPISSQGTQSHLPKMQTIKY